MTVRLERRPEGLVAVKVATGPGDAQRLHREARLLAVARLPGVVQILELADDAEGAALVTRAVVGGSLATVTPLHPDRAVALVAAVAAIVAQLHELGIVHGALDPSHVLLDEEGRPVLCGFGSAGLVGEPLPRRRASGGTPGTTLRPSRDVYALGRLLEHLVARGEATSAGGRRRSRPTASRRSVTALVAQATAEDPTCRPSASSFAASVRGLAPNVTLLPVDRDLIPLAVEATASRTDPGVEAGTGPTVTGATEADDPKGPASARVVALPRRPSRRRSPRSDQPVSDGESVDRPHGRSRLRRRHSCLLAAALTVSAMVGVVLEVGRPDPAVEPPAGPVSAIAPQPSHDDSVLTSGGSFASTTTAVPTDPSHPAIVAGATEPPSETLAGPPTCDDVRQPVAPAAPAAPCTRSAPPPADGIVVGADRYAVGDPGDEVLIGDWRCDTSLDVTVVRPQTGDVYLFEHLPHPGDPTEAAPVQLAHLGPGSHLEAGPADPSGCPALVGRLADGSATGIAVPDTLPSPPSDPEHP